MEINRDNIVNIVKSNHLFADKDYGQNFLVDSTISKRIVDSLDIQKEEKVLEIGPGLGSLTHYIDEITKNYTVVDVDERMVDWLKTIYPNERIICEDIRNFNIDGYDKIIGNLPYNITTELIGYVLLKGTAKKLVLMCQEETLAHFVDTSGKEYGPTSVLVHLLGKIRRLFVIKPGSFYPSPKCKSVLFEIDIEDNSRREDIKLAFKTAKNLFKNRRKTIQNNLKNSYKFSDEIIKNILSESHIEPNKRPEEILPEEYVILAKNINKYIKEI